jgi:heat shock protein HtpX
VKGSFRRRVAGAAAMLVGFYVFAGLVAVGLFGVVAAMWASGHGNLWIAVACIGSGFAILRGLVPRRAKFEDPGPRLEPEAEPELHALVGEVAAATDQAPPSDIYLAPDVNAAVMDTGGLFGSGGRRVMIVGLPLLDALTVGQLRAVLAHEFGHYYGGDTRLGPWFFRTYDAIARTVTHLEARESIWQKPFEWYGMFFLRRSAAIKRQQEFMADELAAKAGGKQAAISCLHAVSSAGPAFESYWSSELAPVLDAGVRTPLLGGFQRFQSAEDVKKAVDENLRTELEQGETDPYDTHPSLRERVAALEKLPDDGRGESPGDERPALSLLRDPEALEQRLVEFLVGPDTRLEPLDWDQVPERVMVPAWREHAEAVRPALAGLTVGGLPSVARPDALADLGAQLPLPPSLEGVEGPFPAELYRDLAMSALDTSLAVALLDAGWTVTGAPGDPVELHNGDDHVRPFGATSALAERELSVENWVELSESAGIANLPLGGSPAAAPQAAPAAAPG